MLIIYAHPNKTGHCGYILEKIISTLNNNQTSFTLLDLYQENYDPVLKAQEHYTSGHYEISVTTKKYQDLLKNEDRFIFIYPTWWNSAPAIIKGFFDRTMTSRFAFRYVNSIPRGLLNGKALVFTTTGGPAFIEKLFLGNRSLKFIRQDVLRFCGIKSKGVLIGSATKFTPQQKTKIDKAVSKNIHFVLK